MTLQIHANLLDNRQVNKADVVIEDVVAALPVAGSIRLYIGGSVAVHRQVEIMNGWKWLYNGIRDRSLVSIDNADIGALLTACDIDRLDEFNRKTSWGSLNVEATDIGLGMAGDLYVVGATEVLEAGYIALWESYLERVGKVT